MLCKSIYIITFTFNVLLEIKSLVPTCLAMSTQFSEREQKEIVSALVNITVDYS